MKTSKYLFLLLFMLLPLLTACGKGDVTDMFNRTEYVSFITNRTNRGVTISYTCYGYSYSYHIQSGEEKEIPTDIHFDFSAHASTIGTVLLTFDDGTVLTHTCIRTETSDSFEPADNNILNANLVTCENCSWTIGPYKANKMRYDYTLK